MSGLFSTFNVATRGMSAQQKAIDVTSHNIANANTEGYSRQRATMETTRPFGMPSMNNATGVGQLGTGVQVSSITRIRDSYLDYQVRTENGTMGLNTGREQFLTEVESIFNEPSETGVSSLIGKMFDSWQTLSGSPESSNSRTVVAQQSNALTGLLNNTYNQLTALKENSQSVIKQDVIDVNSMLDQIDKLNQQVISVKVGGNEPNDLMDKRDLLVDQLSLKFGITIDKKTLAGENLKPTEVGGMGDPYLVKSDPNDEVRRFSYVSSIETSGTQKIGDNGSYTVTYYKNGDMSTDANKVEINMTLTSDEYTSLDQGRVLWADSAGNAIDKSGTIISKDTDIVPVRYFGAVTNISDLTDGSKDVTYSFNGGPAKTINLTNAESASLYKGSVIWTDVDGKPKTNVPTDYTTNIQLFKPTTGELNGYQSVQADIDVYIDQLNSLAKSIAFSINAVHSGSQTATEDELKFFVNSSNKTTDGEAGITAGNISVNEVILDDVMKINVGKDATSGPNDNSKALAIAQLRYAKLDIQGANSDATRNGFLVKNFGMDDTLGVNTVTSSPSGMTIGGYFTDTVNRLAIQTQTAKQVVKNHTTLLASLEESRTSISGVSLDEEMANLIQYQHAYQANAKIISTVDELLDLVINGLKK